jgi:hypothetical protein
MQLAQEETWAEKKGSLSITCICHFEVPSANSLAGDLAANMRLPGRSEG